MPRFGVRELLNPTAVTFVEVVVTFPWVPSATSVCYFFYPCAKALSSMPHAYTKYITMSVHVASQLLPWLAFTNLASFSREEITVLLPAPT